MSNRITAARDILRYLLSHPVAGRQPVRSVGRVILWQLRSRLARKPINHRWIGDTRLVMTRGMPGASGNIYLGLHEFSDMAFTVHFLRPDDRFCDIGANVGTYTVLAAALCGARCDTFEPDADTLDKLSANIVANRIGALVDIHPLVLSGENRKVAFTVGLDTINRVTDAGPGSRTVDARKLDDVLMTMPSLIKIDVEGHEDAVFSGAQKVMSAPQLLAIIVETVGEVALETFRTHGFVERYYDPYRRRISLERNPWLDNNRLFIRESALAEVERRVETAPKLDIFGIAV